MKNLRKIAGISVLFILIFMVIALFQYQEQGDGTSILPNQFEYAFDEDWTMVLLEGADIRNRCAEL